MLRDFSCGDGDEHINDRLVILSALFVRSRRRDASYNAFNTVRVPVYFETVRRETRPRIADYPCGHPKNAHQVQKNSYRIPRLQILYWFNDRIRCGSVDHYQQVLGVFFARFERPHVVRMSGVEGGRYFLDRV